MSARPFVLHIASPATHDARVLVTASLSGIALVVAQAIIDPSTVNVYCSIIVAISTVLTAYYCLRDAVIQRFPISGMAVFGFNVTTHGLALVAQTLYGRPLIYNLLVPERMFEATIMFQAVILAAHITYTSLPALQTPSIWISRRVLMPIWIFRMPRPAELWLLGSLGLLATWISRILFGDAVDFGNVGGKFLQALVPFIVAPFFIPFRGLFLMQPTRQQAITTPLLVGYFGVVVVTAVAFNARAIFAVVLFTVLLTAFLMIAMRRLQISSRMKIVIGAAALASIPLMGMAQDLATAMQIARGLRGSAGPGEIVSETFRAFGDSEALERYRKSELTKTSEGGYSGYSEIYLESEFLQRLTYTKYTDLTMAASLRLTEFQRQSLREDSRAAIISIMPTPIINALGLAVDKNNRFFSTGDLYASMAFNQPPGGQRTGSTITNTIDVLDNLWPPIVFVIYIITFIVLDSYGLKLRNGVAISALAFMLLYEIFARGLIYDSFRNLIDNITRAPIQAIVVYTVLTLCARFGASALDFPAPIQPRRA